MGVVLKGKDGSGSGSVYGWGLDIFRSVNSGDTIRNWILHHDVLRPLLATRHAGGGQRKATPEV